MIEREEIIKFLVDKTPVMLDIDKQEFIYDKTSIYYKIYKYIKELEKIKNQMYKDQDQLHKK